MAYPSCPETKKKLVEINENCWRCEATGKEYPEPQWRYCMSMKAEDHSGHSWVTAFDDTAKMILGVERARSHCRFVLPLIHLIPDSLTYSVQFC